MYVRSLDYISILDFNIIEDRLLQMAKIEFGTQRYPNSLIGKVSFEIRGLDECLEMLD